MVTALGDLLCRPEVRGLVRGKFSLPGIIITHVAALREVSTTRVKIVTRVRDCYASIVNTRVHRHSGRRPRGRKTDTILLQCTFPISNKEPERQPMTLNLHCSHMHPSAHHYLVVSLLLTLFLSHIIVKVFALSRFVDESTSNRPVTKVLTFFPLLGPSRQQVLHDLQDLLLHDR